jgi:hypothetical protein
MKDNKDFWVECDVCGQLYHNWVGSTPCCGSLAIIRTEISFRENKLNKIIGNIKRI